MRHRQKAVWIWVAGLLLLGEGLVRIFASPVTTLNLIPLALAALTAWLLLRASRLIWLLLVFGAAMQGLSFAVSGDELLVSLNAVALLLCLFAPSSRSYVWEEHQPAPRDRNRSAGVVLRIYTWVYAHALTLQARLTSAEEVPFVNARVIGRLIIAFLILVPIVGKFADYREGAGHGKLVVEVAWRVVWIPYNLLQVAIVALLVLAAYRYVRSRKPSYGQVIPNQADDRRPNKR